MKRSTALFLLLVIIVGGWALCTFTSVSNLLDTQTSPVIFVTEDGTNITLAWIFWVVLFVVAWLGLTVFGYTISPGVGDSIFYIGYWVFLLVFDKDHDSSSSSFGGSGSGRSGRGG